jgi:hypothetical protein
MSCEAVVTFVLIEELFPQILVKLSNVDYSENTFSVFWIDLRTSGRTKDARCTGAIRSSIPTAKATFDKKENIFTCRFCLNLSNK